MSAGYGILPIGGRRRTVEFWLRWLVIACVCPAALVAALLILRSYERERTSLERSTIATARALVRAVDRELVGPRSALQVLATSPYLESGDLARFYEQAKELLPIESINNVILTDPAGQQLLNTLKPFGEPLPLHGNLDQLKQVIESGQPVLSDLYIGAVTRSEEHTSELQSLRHL